MKVQDLGELQGDVVLFGGPVSNLHATLAMIDVASDRTTICLGDLAAYCGQPSETIAAIRKTGWPVVAGNCETQLAEGADNCGCGFGGGTTCDLLSVDWYAHADRMVGAEDRHWMKTLPDALTFHHGGKRYVALHASWSANNRFVWPSDDASVFQEEFAAIRAAIGPVDGVIASHSGIAFERVVDGVHWINVGVIGMPPHDGRSDTRHVILSEDGARICRLSYDVDAAVEAMVKVGLRQGYEATLTNGFWPSEDILPVALRR